LSLTLPDFFQNFRKLFPDFFGIGDNRAGLFKKNPGALINFGSGASQVDYR
jgi:hypothetical protein